MGRVGKGGNRKSTQAGGQSSWPAQVAQNQWQCITNWKLCGNQILVELFSSENLKGLFVVLKIFGEPRYMYFWSGECLVILLLASLLLDFNHNERNHLSFCGSDVFSPLLSVRRRWKGKKLLKRRWKGKKLSADRSCSVFGSCGCFEGEVTRLNAPEASRQATSKGTCWFGIKV